MPRSTLICLRHPPDETTDRFEAFCEAMRLRPNQWLQVDLLDAARRAAIPPAEIEAQVLAWADQGWIECRFSGRDLLLQRRRAPDDVAQRIHLWIDRFATIQAQRIDEIAAYARTHHCRHGHLSAYLGDRAIDRCSACDNCVAGEALPGVDLPTERQQLLTILDCLDETGHGWGRFSLIRILRGDEKAPDRGHTLNAFGALRFRSQSMVGALVDGLLDHGLLSDRELSNGGTVLELTPAGQAALRNPRVLDAHLPQGGERQPRRQADDLPEVDGDLYEQLRAWRLAEAKARKVPPYVIFHDAQLQEISATKPQTIEALLSIHGIGARKVKAHGGAVLALVRDHLNREGDSAVPPNPVQ